MPEPAGPRVLNAGCGGRRYEGAVGLDYRRTPTVDVIGDLNRTLPFRDSVFDRIACHQVIEHVHDVAHTMGEFHRVLKPGGRLDITTPHVSYRHSWEDPSHRWHLTLASFEHFVPGRAQFPFSGGFRVIEGRVHLGGPIGHLLSRLFSPRFIDRQVTRIYHGKDIIVALEAVK